MYSKNRLNNAESISCLKSLIRAHLVNVLQPNSGKAAEINLYKLDNLSNIFKDFVGFYEMQGWKNGFTETNGIFIDDMLRNIWNSDIDFLWQS